MFDFLNKPYPFDTDLRNSLSLGSGMGIGIFLFILFFQPFELINVDVNNYILTIAGFGGITFLLISLARIILPWGLRGLINIDRWNQKREMLLLLLIWILNSVAFSFYLAYVGRVQLSMYLAFKIVLLCLVPPVLIMLINEIHLLQSQLIEMRQKPRELDELPGNNNEDEKFPVELISDNRSEKMVLEPGTLILVRSAENYVEILYQENQSIQKKLLRATMKSIEDQLQEFSEMVRCHRTCIINTLFVIKMHSTAHGCRLRILDYDEEIPVSRQYMLGVKAALGKS